MKTHAPKTSSSTSQNQKNGRPSFNNKGEGVFFPLGQVQLKESNKHRPAPPFFQSQAASIQLSPAPVPALPAPVCYEPGEDQPEPTAREPERHPTYGQWLQSFRNMETFISDDTIEGGTRGAHFEVLGEEAASRDPNAPEEEQPVDFQGERTRDRFIDHPTERWVNACLPENLRETAYELPSDCADTAVILRHVWLAAHHRTETYNGWVVGSQAGEARQSHVRGLIVNEVYSGNVHHMVNPYSDARGNPIRDFDILQNLLHPGDVLVWEHHSGGLGTARTGGHTQTIVDISGNEDGGISAIQVLQGNQPIFREQAQEIRDTLTEQGASDIPSERNLRDAPGRRIEVGAMRGVRLGNVNEPIGRGSEETLPVWGWGDADHTTIVAAGPPKSATRPQAQRQAGSRERVRRITDWVASLNRARLNRAGNRASLIGTWEAGLQEMRSLLERQGAGENLVSEADAQALGTAAGNRLRALMLQNREFSDLSAENQANYQQLVDHFITVLQALSEGANVNNQEVERIFNETRRAFESSAATAPPVVMAPLEEESGEILEPGGMIAPRLQEKKETGAPAVQLQPAPGDAFTQGRIEYLRDIRALNPNLAEQEVDDDDVVPAIIIMQTREFRSLMNQVPNSGYWQRHYNLSYEEAVFACRLILKDLIRNNYTQRVWRQPGYVQGFVEQAVTNPEASAESISYGNTAAHPNDEANLEQNYSSYYDLLRELENNIQGLTNPVEFAPHVQTFAEQLWQQSRGDADDHGIYFTRIQARILLQTNPVLSGNTASIRQMRAMLRMLDRISRGMDDIQFPENVTRVLISGFDPFDVTSPNPTSNPSGIIAQQLDGQSVPFSNQGVEQTAHIEAVTFPVTYSAFDQGMVEQFFDPYMNPANGHNIAAVVTISLNSGRRDTYELERHASGQRRGLSENQRIGTSMLTEGSGNYIEEQVVERSLREYAGSAANPDWAFIARQITNRIKAIFHYMDFAGAPALPALNSRQDVEQFFDATYLPWLRTRISSQQQRLLPSPGQAPNAPEFYSTTIDLDAIERNAPADLPVVDDDSYAYFEPGSGNIARPNGDTIEADAQRPGAAVSGSGGSYLSNEIYYRTSAIGARYGRRVPNVHLHVPENASSGQVRSIIRLVLERGI